MKYVLDFDQTLFDASAFIAQVEADGRRKQLITPGIWKHYQVRDFLYEDVLPWLASKEQTDLHILTAMTPSLGPQAEEFQKEKLHNSGFAELVEGITFMVGEKGEVAAEIAAQFPPHEPIIFVDDKLEQCLSVKAALPPAHCFLMVRDKQQTGGASAVCGVHVVHDLADVDALTTALSN